MNTPKKTFQAHGKEWYPHTPGDPMPCDGEAFVECLQQFEMDRNETFPIQFAASEWAWSDTHRITKIIGWRYADSPQEQRAKPVSAWRPIAECGYPTRSILVWCPERRNIYNVSWDCHMGTLGRWRIFGGLGDILTEEPTHFMPLPEPPAD